MPISDGCGLGYVLGLIVLIKTRISKNLNITSSFVFESGIRIRAQNNDHR